MILLHCRRIHSVLQGPFTLRSHDRNLRVQSKGRDLIVTRLVQYDIAASRANKSLLPPRSLSNVRRDPRQLQLPRSKTQRQQPPDRFHPHATLCRRWLTLLSRASSLFLLWVISRDEEDGGVKVTKLAEDLTADTTGRDNPGNVPKGQHSERYQSQCQSREAQG